MKAIVKVDEDNLVVSLDDVAAFAGIQYKSVQEALSNNKESFEELGLEITSKHGGIKQLSLNEYQASFLMTLLKNTKKVVKFKLELIKQFQTMRSQLVREQTKHNLVTYKDGHKSIRKWLKEYEDVTGADISEKQLVKYLVMRNIVTKEKIVKSKMTLIDQSLGRQQQDGVIYNINIVPVIRDFVEGV